MIKIGDRVYVIYTEYWNNGRPGMFKLDILEKKPVVRKVTQTRFGSVQLGKFGHLDCDLIYDSADGQDSRKCVAFTERYHSEAVKVLETIRKNEIPVLANMKSSIK